MLAEVLHDCKVALAFLTRVPVPGGWRGADLAAGMPWFPLIGALIGLAGALLYALAHWLGLPPWPAAAVALATTIWLTGALHEDGLADVADGFGGGRTQGDKLRIMRDPRIGSYGTLALALALLARAGALAGLAEPLAVAAAMVSAGAVSRGALPAVMAALPAAREAAIAALIAGCCGALVVALLARRQIGGHTGDVLGAVQQVTEIAALFGAVAAR
jgi:adenosylcobinamide-GDP ribazoletransferase